MFAANACANRTGVRMTSWTCYVTCFRCCPLSSWRDERPDESWRSRVAVAAVARSRSTGTRSSGSRRAATGSRSGSDSAGPRGHGRRRSSSSFSCSPRSSAGRSLRRILGHGPNDDLRERRRRQHAAAGRAADEDQHGAVPDALSAPRGSRTRRCILGADGQLGRDMFLRILYGAQTSLEVAVLATMFAVAVGVLLGFSPAIFAAAWTPSSRV